MMTLESQLTPPLETLPRTRLLFVGCGNMARVHLERILTMPNTAITGIVEPSAAMLERAAVHFEKHAAPMPPTSADLETMLRARAGEFDAAFIITPHAYHLAQSVACLEAGLDVLLEKPMVLTADEARQLIRARDETGRLLVVAFPGSLSPEIHAARQMLRSGALGEMLNIHGIVWQNWKDLTTGTWRQVPEIAGGGFLFDTGAHLLNTVADLAGEEFEQVAAWLDNRGAAVDILGVVMARLKSGAFVTLAASGDAFPSCASDVRVVCTKGMIRTGIWGERLEVQRAGRKHLRRARVATSLGVWEQFLAVRAGAMENPCPPEVGLRMARLWDAIQASARDGGKPINVV